MAREWQGLWLAGIRAQIGFRRRPGSYGGKPSLTLDNTLARQFEVDASDKTWVTHTIHVKTMEGFADLAVVISSGHRLVGMDQRPLLGPTAHAR